MSTFLLGSGQRPFGQERVSYCLYFRYFARSGVTKVPGRLMQQSFNVLFQQLRSQERGKCDLWVNHSYCPMRTATLSTLSRDRGNWLELMFVAELRAEIVKAERIASLFKRAS